MMLHRYHLKKIVSYVSSRIVRMEDTKEARHSRVDARTNSQRPRQHAPSIDRSGPDGVPVLREVDKTPSLTQGVSLTDNCSQTKKLHGVSLGKQSTL